MTWRVNPPGCWSVSSPSIYIHLRLGIRTLHPSIPSYPCTKFVPSHPSPIRIHQSVFFSSFLAPGYIVHTHPAICHLLPAPTFETTFTPPCPLPPEPSLLRIPNQIWYSARCILAVTANLQKVNTVVGKKHSKVEPADAMKPF